MLKIMFLTLMISSSSLWAKELQIKYNNFQSTITLTSEQIAYQDTTTQLSLKSKKCNEHIIKQITKDLDNNTRNFLLEKVQDHAMTVTIDGKQNSLDQRSARGQFFYNFIDVIKQAKIEELLNCKS